MIISLIHPSRSRPKQAFEAAQRWIKKAGCEVEYILSIDESDTYQKAYFEKYGFGGGDWPDRLGYRSTTTGFNCILENNRSAIDAINNAAKVAAGDLFIQMADDFDCPDDWGLKIIEATKGKTDWILKTNDGIQKWIITLPIMDRAYYNRFGYIYFPDYLHMFCDTELSCVADLTGRRIVSDLLFPHNHYSTGKTQKDDVSIKADATWAQGERLFIERYKKNFGLIDPPGRIQSPEYLNWIKGKL